MDHFDRYKSYTTDDFLKDPTFWNWVMEEGNHENRLFWEAFCESFPEKKDDIRKVRQEIISLNTPAHELPFPRVNQLWKRIRRDTSIELPGARIINFRTSGIAAVVAGFLIVSSILLMDLFRSPYDVLKTGYGARKEVMLPDGSTVTLNSNSELRYAKFEHNKPREAWIQGEAFF